MANMLETKESAPKGIEELKQRRAHSDGTELDLFEDLPHSPREEGQVTRQRRGEERKQSTYNSNNEVVQPELVKLAGVEGVDYFLSNSNETAPDLMEES